VTDLVITVADMGSANSKKFIGSISFAPTKNSGVGFSEKSRIGTTPTHTASEIRNGFLFKPAETPTPSHCRKAGE